MKKETLEIILEVMVIVLVGYPLIILFLAM